MADAAKGLIRGKGGQPQASPRTRGRFVPPHPPLLPRAPPTCQVTVGTHAYQHHLRTRQYELERACGVTERSVASPFPGVPSYKVDQLGCTPLYTASDKGHLEIVRLLVDAGADKDKVTKSGLTPLYVASQRGHLEVVRLLVNAGADKDKATKSRLTPLYIANQEGHLEVARLGFEAYQNAGTGEPLQTAPAARHAPPPFFYTDNYSLCFQLIDDTVSHLGIEWMCEVKPRKPSSSTSSSSPSSMPRKPSVMVFRDPGLDMGRVVPVVQELVEHGVSVSMASQDVARGEEMTAAPHEVGYGFERL